MNITSETQCGPDAADARPETADECLGENPTSSDLYDALEVKIIQSVASWDALKPEWNALFAASPAASPPLRWEWLRIWWDIYAPAYAFRRTGDEGLRIITVWRNGGMIGALPLYIRRPSNPLAARRLGFISTGEAEFEETCAENLGLLYLPDSVAECLQRLGAFLSDSEDWDELDLTGIAADSPLLAWAQNPPHPLKFTLRQQGMCYVGDLSGGFEAYLQRLSRNGRSQARRAVKNGDNAGLRFEVAEDAMQAEKMFAELIALHQARWLARGKSGVFAAPRFEAFHRALLKRGIEQGDAILTRLSANNEPLAMVLGYCTPTKFDCYVHGTVVEEREGVKSPGITGQMLLHQHILARGILRYDHLSGDTYYKQVLSTETSALWSLYTCRRTPRMATQQMVNSTRRAARTSRRIAAMPKPVLGKAWKHMRNYGFLAGLALHERALALLTWQEGLHGIALSLLACQEMLVDF